MTDELRVRLEALLFAAGRPVTPAELASALEVTRSDALEGLCWLREMMRHRGVRLHEHEGEWQLVSAPEAARAIERLAGLPSPQRLSPAALETLAVVAYWQPVTRAQIEAVRGVDCSAVLNGLLSRGLVEEAGRAESVGRPILYATGLDFLRTFGLESLDSLPPVPDADATPTPETPRV
ncbi:MAG: SMC-Scp complex subunit ScpB [Chloroflexota bacterium]|nr:SMC-Scp complex subunit ScpB [Chloroflexota bacterium]